MSEVRLGIDVACRADHRAALADDRGEFIWSGWRFRTAPRDLERLWAKIPEAAEVVVVMEPTRNAWVPLASWFKAHGAKVVMVHPGQAADLRNYYNKYTKTDRLDAQMLARLPLLHPEGLREIDGSGPADALKRATRARSGLVKRRLAAMQRLDALVELLGPVWGDVLGTGAYTKSGLAVLERCSDPRALKRLGRKRLTALLIRTSRGHFREPKADELLAAANETLELWAGGGLDFTELAQDIAAEVRVINSIEAEIATVDERAKTLYHKVDPEGIVVSAPGLGVTLAAAILGRMGDMNRFTDLAAVRSYTGIVPKIDQSGLTNGHKGITKAGDPGLREALYMAADQARKVDPTLAAHYHRLVVGEGKHHVSAVCTIASILITRIAACWRNGQHYDLRDTDGRQITKTEGRAICRDRYTISPQLRAARRRTNQKKKGTGGPKQESTKAAPMPNPPNKQSNKKVASMT